MQGPECKAVSNSVTPGGSQGSVLCGPGSEEGAYDTGALSHYLVPVIIGCFSVSLLCPLMAQKYKCPAPEQSLLGAER